jgi:hypothetical protein
MNIYQPLKMNNESFSSRVLKTVEAQSEKKQASVDKINETLRTEAAQGRLGSIANDILDGALEEASKQSLIGVNQYDVMNKAMPKFYAAKSAVTDLNNSYNAELEAAKADSRIRVDANYLAYLNDKYYTGEEGAEIDLEGITGHAANVTNEGFSLTDNRSLLNFDVIGKDLVDSIGQMKYTIRNNEGNGQFSTTTIDGKQEVTVDGARALMQNEANAALVMDIAGVDSLADLPPEKAAFIINSYVKNRSASSNVTGDVKMNPYDKSKQDYREALGIQSAGINLKDKVDQRIKDYENKIDAHMEATGSTFNEAIDYLKQQTTINEKGEKVYLYDRKELGRAGTTLRKEKATPVKESDAVKKGKVIENLLNTTEGLNTKAGLSSTLAGLKLGTGGISLGKKDKKVTSSKVVRSIDGTNLAEGQVYIELDLSVNNNITETLAIPIQEGGKIDDNIVALIKKKAVLLASNSSYAGSESSQATTQATPEATTMEDATYEQAVEAARKAKEKEKANQ